MGIASTVKGYLDLCRITNLPSIWTNVLCASVLAADPFSWQGFMIPAVSLSCLYLAGMCLNDICDAGHDSIHRPTRPIPSGSVSLKGALLLTAILFLSGAGLLLKAPHRQGFYASFLLLIVIVWYDCHHKQNPFSVLLMASCRFLVFPVTSLALTGTVAASVWCAAAIQFSYVVCISLVARRENSRPSPFTIPAVPLMLAGIPLLDGIILALLVSVKWLLAGIAGALLMQAGQRVVRGD